MKKLVLLSLLACSLTVSYAQTIVNTGIYKANFSNALREPKYVSYTLYKGGGSCDRESEHFDFKNDQEGLNCATDKDYAHNGYDKGHLANAEDFAFDCPKEELTFRYYNCLPQTPNLNRGVWKTNETQIRAWSQKEKLYIVCGGFFGSKKMGNVSVPSACWKVVQSTVTGKVLFCGWFTNTSQAEMKEITVSDLEERLHSHIILYKKQPLD